MDKIFKIGLFIAAVAAYMPSSGMMSAYHKMDASYRQKVEKSHQVLLEQLLYEKQVSSMKKVFAMPELVEQIQMHTYSCVPSNNSSGFVDKCASTTMRLVCQDWNKNAKIGRVFFSRPYVYDDNKTFKTFDDEATRSEKPLSLKQFTKDYAVASGLIDKDVQESDFLPCGRLKPDIDGIVQDQIKKHCADNCRKLSENVNQNNRNVMDAFDLALSAYDAKTVVALYQKNINALASKPRTGLTGLYLELMGYERASATTRWKNRKKIGISNLLLADLATILNNKERANGPDKLLSDVAHLIESNKKINNNAAGWCTLF